MTTVALPDRIPRRGRDYATRRSVILADKAADWTIRIGGIGVIVAVFGIMAFLANATLPLFAGGTLLGEHAAKMPSAGPVLTVRVDEYRTLGVALDRAGALSAFHLRTGTPLAAPIFDFGGRRVTAFARSLLGEDIALGFADGTVRFGRIQVVATVLPADGVPVAAGPLEEGERGDGKAVYTPLPGGQVRRLSIEAAFDPPQQVAEPGTAIVAVDYRVGGTSERPTKVFVTADDKGQIRLSNAETKTNMMTGQKRVSIETSTLPSLPAGVEAAHLLVNDKADMVLVADAKGTVRRYDTRDPQAPVLAETVDFFHGAATLTALGFLIGEQSIVAGASDGAVDVYFKLPRPGAGTADGFQMVRAKTLERHASPVAAFVASQRTKSFVTADTSGAIFVRHSTSEQTMLRLKPPGGAARYQALVLAPRDDAVVAIAEDGRVFAWDIAIPHPETTLKSIFGKVWYEGYPEPVFTWQSSSGTDSFEPKLSLVPLIFGTIKAAFYSMLFAVPVALLAAIYTSEFLHHSVRGIVKPAMEMMASLPSVVLGFIAALILAPIVETWIAAVVLAFLALPLGLFAAAYLWQLLPAEAARHYGGLPKFALMFATVGISAAACYALGAPFERLMFHGDFKAWVNGAVGTGAPFLFLVFLPISFVAALTLADRVIDPGHRDRLSAARGARAALVDLGRWLVLVAAAALIAGAAASVLTLVGYDPRGGIVGTYVQRNTLIVGFAMGFAVIPIVYTIAEDALNAVPEHLRGAALACGATPWQMAITVILPTAASGVFAAIMVGMGRAVGETMIVVMAAGNTPILDMNIFNGLRALSANVAVELPEAVKDGTLYRMLFLAALVLFAMTFAINTLAELIRLRFRKRAAQL